MKIGECNSLVVTNRSNTVVNVDSLDGVDLELVDDLGFESIQIKGDFIYLLCTEIGEPVRVALASIRRPAGEFLSFDVDTPGPPVFRSVTLGEVVNDTTNGGISDDVSFVTLREVAHTKVKSTTTTSCSIVRELVWSGVSLVERRERAIGVHVPCSNKSGNVLISNTFDIGEKLGAIT